MQYGNRSDSGSMIPDLMDDEYKSLFDMASLKAASVVIVLQSKQINCEFKMYNKFNSFYFLVSNYECYFKLCKKKKLFMLSKAI